MNSSLLEQLSGRGFAILPRALSEAAVKSLKRASLQTLQERQSDLIPIATFQELLYRIAPPQVKSPQEVVRAHRIVDEMRREDELLFRLKRLKSHYERQGRKFSYLALKSEHRRRKRLSEEKSQGVKRPISPAPSFLKMTSEDVKRLTEETMRHLEERRKQCLPRDDAGLMRAINEHRCNLWMTSTAVESLLTNGLQLKGELSEVHSTVRELLKHFPRITQPVLFDDTPLVQLNCGSCIGPHCAAPAIGIDWAKSGALLSAAHELPAASMLILCDDCSSVSRTFSVVHNSHHAVRELLFHDCNETRPLLTLDDLWCSREDAWMQSHFSRNVEKVSTAYRTLSQLPSHQGFTAKTMSIETFALPKGTVVVVDPFLLHGFGTNNSRATALALRLDVVCATNAFPSITHSWIKEVANDCSQIDFRNSRWFPAMGV